jgi:hypothetical protein
VILYCAEASRCIICTNQQLLLREAFRLRTLTYAILADDNNYLAICCLSVVNYLLALEGLPPAESNPVLWLSHKLFIRVGLLFLSCRAALLCFSAVFGGQTPIFERSLFFICSKQCLKSIGSSRLSDDLEPVLSLTEQSLF